jgi:hypothetical protein
MKITRRLMLIVLCGLIVLMIALTVGCGPKTWDYVALGDSWPAGFGVEKSYVEYYAEFIEQDLGVRVEVHNFAMSGQSATRLLGQLRNKEELREAIQSAEVITIS